MKLPRSRWRALAVAALLSGVGAGCQNRGGSTAGNNDANLPVLNAPVKNSDRYKVRADSTPFYHYGPQQLNGSDMDLKKETRITMVARGRGYSQIRTADGQTGFVGTEDITQLTVEEIAAEDAARLAATAAAAPPGALNGPVYTIPPEAGRSEGLPMQDPSAPTPPPPTIFRY